MIRADFDLAPDVPERPANPRVSLAALIVVVLFVAVGLTAFRSSSSAWFQTISCLTTATLFYAVIAGPSGMASRSSVGAISSSE